MLLKLLPLALFVALAAFLWEGLSLDPSELPSPLIDHPAPEFSLATLPRPGAGGAGVPSAGQGTSVAAAGTSGAADTEAGTPTDGTLGADAGVPAAGGTFDSASMNGRVWLLNVWASWCGPCAEEHPQLLALAAARDVPIVGLNYKDAPEDARAWLARHGDVFSEVLSDSNGAVGIDWGVYGVPETFVIDAEGRVRYKHIGPILAEDLQETILPILDRLATPS